MFRGRRGGKEGKEGVYMGHCSFSKHQWYLLILSRLPHLLFLGFWWSLRVGLSGSIASRGQVHNQGRTYEIVHPKHANS
jgi:hypothetical protein